MQRPSARGEQRIAKRPVECAKGDRTDLFAVSGAQAHAHVRRADGSANDTTCDGRANIGSGFPAPKGPARSIIDHSSPVAAPAVIAPSIER